MKEVDLTALVRLFISLFIYFACLSVAKMKKFPHKIDAMLSQNLTNCKTL